MLESFGYFVIFLSVLIECGILIGLVLPLPGFSLLFAAGVFAATGKLDLFLVILVGTVAATLGYIIGYYTGLKYGRKLLYEKNTEKYFTVKQGKAAEKFMNKHGYSTLIVGRWLPILHNIAPLLSGVAKTPMVPFMLVNIIGGLAWVSSAAYAGYSVGHIVPNAQYYIIPFVLAAAIVINTPYCKRRLLRLTKKIEEY